MAKARQNQGKATASPAVGNETTSKSKQEVGESSHMEGDAVEFWESDDYETDEEEVAARWNHGFGEPNTASVPDVGNLVLGWMEPWIWGRAAARHASPVLPPPPLAEEELLGCISDLAAAHEPAELGNGGVVLVLVETPNGFAVFVYDGIQLLEQNAYQNIWVDFTDDTVAKTTVWLVDSLACEDKLSAINPITGVSAELATMINKHIDPGQKIAVENEDYKKAIETNLNISCLCGGTVEELIWGLKVQMPYLLKPQENLELDKEALFPMSNGMKMFLNSHGFIFEPDEMVTRHVIKLAGVARECDRCVNKHESSLRGAAEHLKKISRIDTENWDLMKLATALKMICYPNEKVPAPRWVFSKRDLFKLRKDAPKYEGKILKRSLLIIYDEINSARGGRYTAVRMLSRLLHQAQRAAGQSKSQIHPSAPVDSLKRYTCISCHPLHKTNEPGILCMHIHPSKDIVATGGIDTRAVLFDQLSGQTLCTLTDHSKKITTLKFVNRDQLFITGSADKTVRIWRGSEYGNYSCIYTLKDHTDEVVAVTVDASEKYFVTASKDNSWCFYDILTGSCLSKVGKASEHEGYTSASFDPHGIFLGTGTTAAVVKIWDVRTQSSVGKLEGHVGPVTAMSFSENGHLLATAALDGVQLWDFRKLRNLRTISPYDSDTPTNAVEFDLSGSYLGIGGSDTRVYQVDKDIWNPIKTLPDLSGTGKVTSLKFGAEAKYIAVGSMDHNLRIFGLPRGEQMDD